MLTKTVRHVIFPGFLVVWIGYTVTQVTCKSTIQKTTTLKLLQIVHNPGLSTPSHTFTGDPNRDQMAQLGFGQLTNLGKGVELRLGQMIRKRYGGKPYAFIDDYYRALELQARSRDQDASLSSALALLAGLYPPKDYQVWDSKLKWQPIPVHTVPGNADILLWPSQAIDNYSQLIGSSKRKKFNKQNQDVYERLSSLSGTKVTTAEDVTIIEKALQFAEEQNLSRPTWALDSDVRSTIRNISDFEFALKLDTEQLQAYTSGVLFNEIVRNIDNKSKNGCEDLTKIKIYSTSDLVLAGMLALLNVFNESRPVWGSALFIEFHQDSTISPQSFIKVMYKNGANELSSLVLPFCPDTCSLAQIQRWTSKINSAFGMDRFLTTNLIAINVGNKTNDEMITMTITVTTTSVIIIGGFALLLIAVAVCVYSYCSRRRAYVRI